MILYIFYLSILNFAIFCVSVFALSSGPIVSTKCGKIKGEKVKGSEGDEFYSFRGIPYAKPPIGELRFSDPEPPELWRGVRETTAYGSYCAQHNWFTDELLGDEDCLYLNIFTKSIKAGVKRPAMVWIHGGGFVSESGGGEFYGPDYFMRKDIVLVTINYRLGIFGFLSLNHEVAAGNQGLKDQVLALQWVHNNIANFGGDPNDVTIFGESAGGASVHFLTISPLSRGLFHKAIIQSGNAFIPFLYQPKPEESANEILNKLNHTDNDPESSIAFLRTLDVKTILKARKELIAKEDKLQFNFGFVPCVDSKSKNPFMPVDLEVAAADGILVPLIIGYNSHEGNFYAKQIGELGDRINDHYPKLFHSNIVDIFKNKYNLSIDSLKRMYFGDELPTQGDIDKLVDLIGDIVIVAGVHRIMEIQVEKGRSPTYFYEFTYNTGITPFKILLGSNSSGAGHADELLYQFKQETLEDKMKFLEKGSENYRLMEQMIEMWVNFATTGVPTPTPSTELLPFHWLPINNEAVFSCLNISANPRMENVTNIERKFTSFNDIHSRITIILRLIIITTFACICACGCIMYLRCRSR